MSPRAQSRGHDRLKSKCSREIKKGKFINRHLERSREIETKMKSYYVYIVRCNDNSLYTGITNDVNRRISEHNDGLIKTSYTYSRRPVELLYNQEFSDPDQAILFEKKIKKWSSLKKEALIEGNYKKLQVLSECRNARHFKYKPDSN